eukprot:3329072-Prymnesium_polylepis.1
MGARNGSSFSAAARCGFLAIVLLGASSRARTGAAVVGPCWSRLGFESRRLEGLTPGLALLF